jgi:hypothetical protein
VVDSRRFAFNRRDFQRINRKSTIPIAQSIFQAKNIFGFCVHD